MSRIAPHVFLLTALAAVGAQSPADRAGAPRGAFVDDVGVIHRDAAPYRARFGDAAVIEVAGGPEQDRAARLQLRFTGARRGATWLPRDLAARPSLAGDTVRWQHGDVTETYSLRPACVEQSFVFAERPAGAGDLVVEIAAGGNVTAAASEAPRHGPLEFRFADAPAIRYGEAIAIDRCGKHVEIATGYDGAGQITLTVPAAFVDDAVFPLTVDPSVGPPFLPTGVIGDDENEPDVAHDPELDRFLVVWHSAGQIRATLCRGDGTIVTYATLVAGGGGLLSPSVALVRSLTVDAFLVVWDQASGIRGRLIDAQTGLPLAASFTISSPAAGERDRRPSVSGPAGAILVAWDRTASGATEPNRVLVRDLYWGTPTSPGTVTLGSERLLHSTVTGSLRNVRLAPCAIRQQGGSVTTYATRAVWEHFFPLPAPGDSDVLTASFQIAYPSAFNWIQPIQAVPGGAAVGVHETRPAIGVCASGWTDPTDLQYLVVWEDGGDVLGARMDLQGALDFAFTIRATSAFEGWPAVGAGHCEFTVAYMQSIPASAMDNDVYAARVLLDGTLAQNHSFVDDPGARYQDHLRASSIPLTDVAPSQRNTSLLTWMGQTGPIIGLDDVRARFFEPVAAASNLYGSACPGPLGELPAIGWSGGEPVPGNDAYSVTLTTAPAVSLAALLVGGSQVDVPIPGAPGCSLYANLPFITILPAITDASGTAVIALPMPCSLPLSPVSMQWGVLTPGWNPFGWITSNDLYVNWLD